MIWGLAALVLAALVIAYFVWMRHVRREYFDSLADLAKRPRGFLDPWEEPQIITTLGGIHDVEQDEWR